MCFCFGEIFPLSWPLISSVAYRGSDTFSDTFDAHFLAPNVTNIKKPVTGTFGFMFMITHTIEL